MKNLLIILSFLICSSVALATESPRPIQFELYYGSALSGYSTMKLENEKVIYTDHNPSRPAQDEIINPSQEKWAVFRKELDKLNLWSWKSEYFNPKVMDGTQWNIKISYQDKSLISRGSNAYPLADGTSNNSPEPSDQFKAFLKVLKDLTGKELQ